LKPFELMKGRRIAVVYDCAYPHVPGGGQKRLFEIFRRLVRRGWAVDWYCLQSWDSDAPLTIEGIRYVPVAPGRPLYDARGKRIISQTFYYGRSIARFPSLGGYDFVHMGQWPYFHFFPIRLFSLFGGARVSADWWEVWGSQWLEYYGAKGRLGMMLERVCAHLPSHLVAISETGERQLRRIGVVPQRITIIHNGLDYAAIRTAPPARSSSDLVYLGRLQPHKNVNVLIEALALLRAEGQRLRLAIIGEGPERVALTKLAESLGVADQIEWLGAMASDVEVYGHLQASRVFVHPSTKEGGGSISSLEANAAGLPVVAFSHPGGISPELIIDGVNGVWVQTISASGLARGIRAALAATEFADARERAQEFAARFDWGGLADQYERLFQSQLRSRSA
jgi:glycosyltransferase involved in cell wall biosynthesis